MSEPLQYNEFVRTAFASPKYIFTEEAVSTRIQAIGGDRETGVEFTLFLEAEKQLLNYKFYGSPYALAAAEYLCREFQLEKIKLGDRLDLELLKVELSMPYNYFFVLLALEDAWLALCKFVNE